MIYHLRYLIKGPRGDLQQLGADEQYDDLIDEEPLPGFGSTAFVEGAVYRVGSMPRVTTLKPDVSLYEMLLVGQQEYERIFFSGRIPVATLEPGFDPSWHIVE